MPAPQTPRIPLHFEIGEYTPRPLVITFGQSAELLFSPFDLSVYDSLAATWRALDGGPGVLSGEWRVNLGEQTDLVNGVVQINFDTDPLAGFANFPTYGDWKLTGFKAGSEPTLLAEGPWEQSKYARTVRGSGGTFIQFLVAVGTRDAFEVDVPEGGGGGAAFPTYFQLDEPGSPADGESWVRGDPTSFESHYPDFYGTGMFVASGGTWYPVGVVRLSDESHQPIAMVTAGSDGNIVIERFNDDSDHFLTGSIFVGDNIFMSVAPGGDSTRYEVMRLSGDGLSYGGKTWDDLVPVYNWRGVWQPHTVYNPGDAFSLFGEGAWFLLVARGYYDGNAAGISPPYDHPAVQFIGGPFGTGVAPVFLRADQLPLDPTGPSTEQTMTFVPSDDGFFIHFDDGVVGAWDVGPIALSDDEPTVQAAFDAQFGAGVITVAGAATDFTITVGGSLSGLNLNATWGSPGNGAIIPGAGAVLSIVSAPVGSVLITSDPGQSNGTAYGKFGTGKWDWAPFNSPAAPPRQVNGSATDIVSQGEGTLTVSACNVLGVITPTADFAQSFVGQVEIDFAEPSAGEDAQPIVINLSGIIGQPDGQSTGYYDVTATGPVGLISGILLGDEFIGMLVPYGTNTVQIVDMTGAPVTQPIQANDVLKFRLAVVFFVD